MRRMALVIVLGMVLSACAGDADPGSTPAPTDPTGTAAPTQPPAEGGTLVAAISSDPGTLNPAITTSGGVHAASELLFNGMVELNNDGVPEPSLAHSWDIEEDGALYRFHLVEGVTWHDGEPFTAEDVRYTFEEVLLEFHSRTAASVGASIDSITVIDDLTIEFRFQFPYAPFLQQLGVTEAPIIPRHIYEGTNPQENPANLAPVGTGPFRFVSYSPTEIRYAKNENYFKPGLPIMDEVVLRVIEDDATAVAALERGEVDFLYGVPGPERERLLATGDYGSIVTNFNPGGANCIMTISFNLDREMFQDVRTRRAISHALDKQAFVDTITFGQGRVADAPISSGIPFAHHPDVGLPAFDRAAAEALLDEVGWVLRDGDGTRTASGVSGVADGTPLSFEFLSFPGFSSYGDLVRAQLLEIGVEVTTRTEDPPVFAETVFTNRDFDTNIISYCNGPDPEIGVSRMYLSDNIGPVPFSNSSAYQNEDVDRLFAEAARTVDTDARALLYREITEILAEEVPYIWMVETLAERVFTNRCRDVGHSGHFAETARCTQ